MTAIARGSARVDPVRVLGVTLGLGATGSVFGAAAGMLGLVMVGVIAGPLALPPLEVLAFAGAAGGVIGAVLTPIAAWLLLRRVPFKRLFPGALAGTVLGGVLGWLLAMEEFLPIGSAVLGAIAGFLTAALVMRRTVRPATLGEGTRAM